MPLIELETAIRAPIERCFDLARSIDFHVVAAGRTQERPIGGRRSGLIEAGETVTWRARHLGLWLELTVAIDVCNRPRHFRDIMTDGPFASMKHDHDFRRGDGGTAMIDRFLYHSPLGLLGMLFDKLYLAGYMRRFLQDRALLLKSVAESDNWRRFVDERGTAPLGGADSS